MRKRWLLVFLWMPLTAVGQQRFNADSVEQLFATLPDTLKIRQANNLMKFYMDTDLKKSMYYAKQAIALAKINENKSDVAYTYISWAIAQYNYGNYDSALYYNQQALTIYEVLDDTLKMATAFNNMSITHNALGDFSTASYYSYKAYGIYLSKKNWRKAAVACLNLSTSYFEAKDYAATLYWSREAYRYYQTIDRPEDLGYALQIFVDVHIALQQIDSARFYLRQIQQLNTEYPNEYLETVNLSQRGEVYLLEKKYDSALVVGRACIQFYEKLELPENGFHTRLLLARVYLALQQPKEALRYAQEVHTSASRIRNKQMMIKSSVVLADIFASLHQPQRALQHAQLASAYKDSVMLQSLRGSIQGRMLSVELETETKAKLLAMTALQHREALIGKQWFVIILITVGLLTMAVIAYLIRRVGRYRKKINDQLTHSNEQLSQLNHEINGLVNTIVHDLKSPLNSVKGVLAIIEMNGNQPEDMPMLIQLAKKSIDNGHNIIRQLLELREVEENAQRITPSLIDASELVTEIYDSFCTYAQQKDIRLSVQTTPCNFISDKLLVRRILDNLVSNALKFSPKKSEVTLTVKQKNNHVTFEVADKGPGFTEYDLKKMYGKFQKLSARPTAGEHSSGLGLAAVNASVKHLGATIQLQTAEGKGSVFSVSFSNTGDKL